MPLTRLGDNAYAVELEGVAFGMNVVGTNRPQRCLVTYEALTDAMGGNPNQAEQVEWFRANRSDVEDVASRKFDDDRLEGNGTIRVNSRDPLGVPTKPFTSLPPLQPSHSTKICVPLTAPQPLTGH
jgi:hypothetical protein